jgi:hypothetical protein
LYGHEPGVSFGVRHRLRSSGHWILRSLALWRGNNKRSRKLHNEKPHNFCSALHQIIKRLWCSKKMRENWWKFLIRNLKASDHLGVLGLDSSILILLKPNLKRGVRACNEFYWLIIGSGSSSCEHGDESSDEEITEQIRTYKLRRKTCSPSLFGGYMFIPYFYFHVVWLNTRIRLVTGFTGHLATLVITNN